MHDSNRTITEGTEAFADLHFTATLSENSRISSADFLTNSVATDGRVVPAKGTNALFQHPVIKLKKVNEENRNGDLWVRFASSVVWSNRCANSGQHGPGMNTIAQHTDYSLMLGVVSAVAILCFMLMAWVATKTLWKTYRRAQLERKWRRAKGF